MATRWSLRRLRILSGTKFLLVAGLVAFVGLAWIVEGVAGLDGPVSLGRPVALVMAGIPAALWLAFFYLLDRHEPEPKHFVVGVTVLGALVAAPLADFLIAQAAPPQGLTQPGVSPWSSDRLLHAIAVVALAQELCKYAVVRYTVYLSPAFSEPIDGVVYMMSAGTGVAVWINYHHLSGLGHTVYLSTGAAQAVITTLAHASFAGVLGVVMGRAKFSRRGTAVRAALVFLGLLGAAALSGQFYLFEQWLTGSGLGTDPWKGVGSAAALAVGVFTVLLLVSRRLVRPTVAAGAA